MKSFCFTMDDNIRFLKEISLQKRSSMFEHPYLAMLRSLHDWFGIKIQLNLFYRMEGFDLTQVDACYAEEWRKNADWLKLSFHSDVENVRPYEHAPYVEVFRDCYAVHEQILRFASAASLAQTTTVHYCRTTSDGLEALSHNGVKGLLGLFGDEAHPSTSYGLEENKAALIRGGEILSQGNISFASIDMVINTVKLEDIVPKLTAFMDRPSLRVMIHEQYFYEDYRAYQPDFEEKLRTVFGLLCNAGYQSCFFEELI